MFKKIAASIAGNTIASSVLGALGNHAIVSHLKKGEIAIPESAINAFIKHTLVADQPELEEVFIALSNGSIDVHARVHKLMTIPVHMSLDLADQTWRKDYQEVVFEGRESFERESSPFIKQIILSILLCVYKKIVGDDLLIGLAVRDHEYLAVKGKYLTCQIHKIPQLQQILETQVATVQPFKHFGITNIEIKDTYLIARLGIYKE